MTNATQKLLDSIEALSAEEQHELLAQLLRRLMDADYGTFSDATMLHVADAAFQEYDLREGAG